MNERSKQCVLHTAKIEQLLDDMKEIKEDIRSVKSEAKSDRKELWDSFNSLRESITGNSYVEQLIMLSYTANHANIQELKVCNTAHNSLCYYSEAVI